jgi:hypothetical protein
VTQNWRSPTNASPCTTRTITNAHATDTNTTINPDKNLYVNKPLGPVAAVRPCSYVQPRTSFHANAPINAIETALSRQWWRMSF